MENGFTKKNRTQIIMIIKINHDLKKS